MPRKSVIAWLIVISTTGCSHARTPDTRQLAALEGCWEVGQVTRLNRPPSEWRLFSWTPDSSLAQSLIYEVGPRSRVWTTDVEVSVEDGSLSWNGMTGVLNATRDTMMVSGEVEGQEVLWRFVRHRPADSLMTQLRSYPERPYVYRPPETREDGWQCDDMAAAGIAGAKIAELIEQIKDGRHGDIHSFLIAKDGRLVVEEYFAEDGAKHGPLITDLFRDRVHHLASTTKSVTSLLVGIAIDRGFIHGVEDPISQYLPDYASLFTEGRERITISHMLTMTPGFQWRQFRVSDDRNDGMLMWRTDDVIRFVLEKPLESEPGMTFNYTNGVPTVTGAIIKNATGMEVTAFAEKELFHPLGITNYIWTSYPDGSLETDGGLALRSRDLAKIGQLCLNGGTWEGQRIVSEEWIRESTKERLRFGMGKRWGYGYHWTQSGLRVRDQVVQSCFVPGDGSQILAVFPDQRMVVVFTAGNYGVDPNPVYYSLFGEFILPAVMAGQ